jgi:polyisoprenoid-binding protein YceI
MPKRTLILTLLLLTALLVAACGGAAAPAPAAEAPAAEAPAAEAPAAEAPAEEAAAEEAPVAESPAEQAAAEEAPAAEEPATEGATTRTFAIAPDATTAQYAVEEEFFGQDLGFVTAIGRTQTIDGQIDFAVDGATLQDVNGTFNVDLRTLTSDRSRRDSLIRERWLESDRYPMATFTATGVSDLPADAALGQEVAFKLTGDMTIREVTNPWTWDITANLDGSTLTGTATSFFFMKDFGFDPPAIANILEVTDGVTVTVDFTAQEVQ